MKSPSIKAASNEYCLTISCATQKRGVDYSSRVSSISIDEDVDPLYPVIVEFETIIPDQNRDPPAVAQTGKRRVQAKHVVGADGAHSVVRRSMSLDLVGESKDYIWGVVDLAVNTDFPDI